MKLLRVTAQGLPLFKEKLDLPFYAQQRVAEEDKINLHYSWVCQVFCVSFKKIFWGGSPPHSYIAKLLKINSLKHSL